MSVRLGIVFVAAVIGLSACGEDSNGAGECAVGERRCACDSEGACNEGLECIDEICVSRTDGADASAAGSGGSGSGGEATGGAGGGGAAGAGAVTGSGGGPDASVSGGAGGSDAGSGGAGGPDAGSGGTVDPDAGAADSGASGGAGGSGGTCTGTGTRCSPDGSGVEGCIDGSWQSVSQCAQGCSSGECMSDSVACTPGAVRCYAQSVKRCNGSGTAWVHDRLCEDACAAGVCTGTCTPGAHQCDGSDLQECNGSGTGWALDQPCSLGCDHDVCVETSLTNSGNVVSLSGNHVYTGCVRLELGGILQVPAGQTLEIWASCLETTAGTEVQLGAGSSFIFHASSTVSFLGGASGNGSLKLSGWVSTTIGGTLTTTNTILRGDTLTIASGGNTGTGAVALYGTTWENLGTHTGIVSVMPPESISSVSHPEGGYWNLSGDLDIAWDRPFPGVVGYYVEYGGEEPDPATSDFVTTEHYTIPETLLGPGDNVVKIIAVNPDSDVGTYSESFTVRLNVTPPVVSSSSHPVEAQWYTSNDVLLQWANPAPLSVADFVGFYYLWSRQADAIPGPGNGTFTTGTQLLLPDQAVGAWFMNVVNVDKLGRTSPLVGRYEVWVGPQPASGNVAGTVRDEASGNPISSAVVTLNGGYLTTTTNAAGDYTFLGAVPVIGEPYTVKASATDHVAEVASAQVTASQTTVVDFSLDAAPPAALGSYRLGWLYEAGEGGWDTADLAIAPQYKRIWSTGGDYITGYVGGSYSGGSEFFRYSVGATLGQGQNKVGYANNGFFAAYGAANGNPLFVRTWDKNGAALANASFGVPNNACIPAMVWNGTTYGVFFISYSNLMFQELSASLQPLTVSPVTVLALGYDIRSGAEVDALWDGTGYAVLVQAQSFRFYRFGLNPTTGATTSLTLDPSSIGRRGDLTFDGTRYHAAYERYFNSQFEGVLRTIDPNDTVSSPTIFGATSGRYASIAYDGRNLLVSWGTSAADPTTWLEIRSPEDHSLVQSFDLGPARRTAVAADPRTGDAAVMLLGGWNVVSHIRDIWYD